MNAETLNLGLSIAGLISSIVLSVVAIWMSMYFFTSGKETETQTRTALGEIRSQTTSLEKL